MGQDHDHTASKTHPREPDRHGGKSPRINSAFSPYGAVAYGAIGTGTFLGGAGGGPGQPQSVYTSGGVGSGNGYSSGSAMSHLSPDQFPSTGGFPTNDGDYTGEQAEAGAAGNGGAGDPAATGVAQ